MSIATSDERLECAYCGGDRSRDDSGSYCSELCATRHRGEKAINQIESDHQLCSSCYGRIKEVEPAPRRAPKCADGFQYPTPRTTIGVDNARPGASRPLEHTRWSCVCGAVDPNDVHGVLQEIDRAETRSNLFRALEYLDERGAIAHSPSFRAYKAALEERYFDLEYAVGRAIAE